MLKPQPWKLLAERLAYNGFRKIARRKYQLPNGRVTDFDIKLDGPAVLVVAITPDNQVVLIRQYRPGPNEVLLELPGGGLDKGLTPQAAARKELLEETGYDGDFQYLGWSYREAWSTHVTHHFVATGCREVQAPHRGPNEILEIELTPLSRYRQLLKQRAVMDVETGYLALDHLGML